MPTPVIESVVSLLNEVFPYEIGSPLFNIMLGVPFLAWLVAARVFMAMFGSKRGIFAAFFALALPLGIALLAYGMAELHAVPLLEYDWAPDYIPWAGFGLFVFLSVIVFAKRFFDVSTGVAVFIYLVATAAALGAYWGAQVTIGVIEAGGDQVELRERRVKDEIDSLL